MKGKVTEPGIALLLQAYDQAYDKRSWHGTSLRGSVRGLPLEVAEWRPHPGRHNIREVVQHAAYWKYAVWRRLQGGKRGSFPLKGSNWFPCADSVTEAMWKEDVALLDRFHKLLREAITQLRDDQLPRRIKGSKSSAFTLITGITAHDLYHAGQIQLLKRLRSR